METAYDPPDVLVVPELPAVDPFDALVNLVAERRQDLKKQGQGTVLRKVSLFHAPWKHVLEDPKFRREAERVDPGGIRLNLPAYENLRLILGCLFVEIIEGPPHS